MNNIKENPFCRPYDTPFDAIPFDRITPEHFVPALKEGIRQEQENIDNICNNPAPATFENTIVAYESGGRLISDVMCAFNALIYSHSNDTLVAVENELQQLYTEHRNNITLNEALFARIKSVYDNKPATLTGEQERLVEDIYTAFVQAGANLKGEEREIYRDLSKRLTLLSLNFQENIIKDTDKFTLLITCEEETAGLPDDLVETARRNAEESDREGWLFTLHRPSYIPFMTFCKNRELRRKMYMEYSTIGAKGNEHDNRKIVTEIVNARLELARLLGYNTYSDYILAERMAQTTDSVFAMLGKLTWSYLPNARKEIDEVMKFAAECEGDGFEFKPWDFAYYSEKLKESKFDLSDEAVRPYLNLDQAIYGMFYLATRLYGITFKQNHDTPTFNPDVKVWEVYDYNGEYLALLYCDFYSRRGKHAGAWMDSIKAQYKGSNGENHRPHITLSTNFRKPLPGKPTLLNFDELNTLLHEFGHCLHGILSDVTYATLCSPNVLWDFVEMPSQIMENYTTEEEFLKAFAFHHETGETIPAEMLEKIRKARTFNVAYQCIRQVGLGLTDQAWHNISQPFEGDVLEYEHRATEAVRLLPAVKECAITPQFSHIMSGGYAAGYYSYKWAEMLDADAFSLFKQEGIMNMKTAQSFRDNILSKGNTEHPMTLYMRFRGHRPQIEPLLERDGIKTICPHF